MNILKMSGAALLMAAAPAWASETKAQQPATPAAPTTPVPPAADSMYRGARALISNGNFTQAATEFHQLNTDFAGFTFSPDAMYWEAFAHYRKGGSDELRQAQAVLEKLQTKYPTYVRMMDASSLSTRICGELAREGDAVCAAQIASKAAWAAGTRVSISAAAQSAIDASVSASTAHATITAREIARETAIEVASGSKKAASDAYHDPTDSFAWGTTRTRRTPSDTCPREEDDDRVAALNALLQMDAASAEPLLEKVLSRRDACSAGLRRKAVFLVSQKRSPQAVDVLVNVAKTDPEPEVREQAVFWLSQVPSERTVSVLNDILTKSSDQGIREKAIFAISQSKSEQAKQILRDYASNTSAPADLRERAIFWIGQSPGSDNQAFLRSLYSKITDPQLKEKTLSSLATRRDAENASWLLTIAQNTSEPLESRKKALFWAGQAGVSTDELVKMYDKLPLNDLREQMIFVLSQRRDPAATDKLFAIARSDKDNAARQRAIFWLGQSHDPRAVQLLSELINK